MKSRSGNSKKILPFWATLAQELDEAGVAITVGLIDSTQNRQNLASRYVHTLPQIFIFHGGQIVAHLVNERTLDDLKAAVVTVTELSESDLDDRKAEVLKQVCILAGTHPSGDWSLRYPPLFSQF